MTETPSHPPPLDYTEAPPYEAPSEFELAFQEVIGLEGGYVNDPDDYGGETNWGISKRSYPELNIKDLSLEQAQNIYYRDYWSRMRLNEVAHPIAVELFEQGVNLGTNTAITNLQRSINLLSPYDEFVVVDGVIGPETLAAVNKIAKTDKMSVLLKCLDGFQFSHYLDIAEKDYTQRKFFVGWLKRIA